MEMERCSFGRMVRREEEEREGGEENRIEEKGIDEEEVTNSMCEWSSSLLLFSHCTEKLKRISILKSAKGGVRIEEGADVEIVEGAFEANY